MDSLEELLLVRGITRELFFGTEEIPGIADYLTTQGNDGKININTAHPLVLRSLSDNLVQEMVDEMIAYREDEDNDLRSISWYKEILDSEEDIDHLVTTSSHFFEIQSTGILETMNKRVEGLVKREKDTGTIRIVSWRSE